MPDWSRAVSVEAARERELFTQVDRFLHLALDAARTIYGDDYAPTYVEARLEQLVDEHVKERDER